MIKQFTLILLILAIGVFVVVSSTTARAQMYSVPSGCSAPPTTFNLNWYVDPINGSDTTGDGSQANPWKTLQTVINTQVAAQKYASPYILGSSLLSPLSGVIHGGDVIWLTNGNYGTLKINGLYNSNYVTLKALPDTTPTFNNIFITGGSNWIFDSIKVEDVFNATEIVAAQGNLVSARSNASSGPLSNIIFHGLTIKSADDTSTWAPADWLTFAATGIFVSANVNNADGSDDYLGVNDGTCFTIDHNAIQNVNGGIGIILADKVLVNYNTIDRFSGDGIDYGVSDALFDNNVITNSIDDGNGLHRDGMQGQIYYGETQYNHDLTFSNNIVIQRTDVNLQYNASIQGIDEFDGEWDNINAYNNVIIVNSTNALVFAGVQGANIINNTIIYVYTTTFLQPGAQAGTQPLSAGPFTNDGNAGGGAAIGVTAAKSGLAPTNVVIQNNVSSSYSLTATGIVFNNNILISNNPSYIFESAMAGANPTIVDPAVLFADWDPANYRFDVHLASSSPAIGFGITDGAPATDIYGTIRVVPYDAGAIASQTVDSCNYIPLLCLQYYNNNNNLLMLLLHG